jgi:hypothetical protein
MSHENDDSGTQPMMIPARTYGAFIFLCVACAPFASRAQIQAPGTKKHFIQPPKPEDVASVCDNMMMLDHGSGELDLRLDKARVMEFLAKGEARPMDDKLTELAPLSLPESIKKNKSLHWDGEMLGDDPSPRDYYNWIKRTEGVVVTKQHHILFFRLLNDRALNLSDDSRGECALVLGKDAGTSAPWVKSYIDFSRTYAQEVSLPGIMRPPKPEEVAALVNRTDDKAGTDDHIPVSEKRIKKILAEGQPDIQHAGGGDHAAFHILPEKLDASMVKKMQRAEMNGMRWPAAGAATRADGVMALRNGEVIFWEMMSDFIIRMVDSQGRTCALQLHEEKRENDYAAHFAIDGHVYESSVPLESVRRAADWSPEGGPPPLDEAGAMKIARGELARIVGAKALPLWRVNKVELLTPWDTLFKWYYSIDCVKPLPASDVAALPSALREVFRDEAIIYVSLEGQPGRIQDFGNGE